MMPKIRFPAAIGPSHKMAPVDLDSQRTLNMFPERYEVGGKDGEQFLLRPTPGLTKVATAPVAGETRCLYTTSKGELIAFVGQKIYSVDSSYVFTELKQGGGAGSTGGTISLYNATGRIRAVDNGTYGMFTASTVEAGSTNSAYFLGRLLIDNSSVNRVRSVTILSEAGARALDYKARIEFKDGRFVIVTPSNVGGYYYSDLYSTDIDALSFSTAESNPDPIVGVVNASDYLWFLGSKTGEIWGSNPDNNLPYIKTGGGLMEYGMIGATEAKLGPGVVFLGARNGKPSVWLANSSTPQRITTHAEELQFKEYTLDDAFAWVYQDAGHEFYVLTFPTDGKTHVFDLATGLWHERSSFGSDPATGGTEVEWRPTAYTWAYDKHIVGDSLGNLYEIDSGSNLDNGYYVPRERIMPELGSLNDRNSWDEVEVDCQTGVGLLSGQGEDPQIMMSYSYDGGYSWIEKGNRSMGRIGQRTVIPRWHRLGSHRRLRLKFRVTDPVDFVLKGINVTINGGR